MRLTLHGVDLEVADGPNDAFWRKAAAGRWERKTFKAFRRLITPETSVIDIGAWIGPTALYAASRARHVYAFEPDPAAFAELQRNVALNPGLGRIEAIERCVTTHGRSCRLSIVRYPGSSMSSLVVNSENGVDVASVRLPEFLAERGIEGPLFVKMDVEGYEYELPPSLIRALGAATYCVSLHPATAGAWRRWKHATAFLRSLAGCEILSLDGERRSPLSVIASAKSDAIVVRAPRRPNIS